MSSRRAALEWLAARYPWPASASDELVDALELVDAAVDAETVVAAGYLAGVLAGTAGLAAGLLLVVVGVVATEGLPPVTPALALGTLAGLATTHAVHSWPRLRARLAVSRAVGTAPSLVSRVVLRMQLTPTLEAAMAATVDGRAGPDELTKVSTGPMGATRLGAHAPVTDPSDRSALERAVAAAATDPVRPPGEALAAVGRDWRGEFPPISRAVSLLRAASDAAPARRDRNLERAVEAVLRGARDRLADGLAALEGPLAALYAGGVVLPLALVGLVPAADVAGYSLDVRTVVLVYDVVLPLAVASASGWLLLRRPIVRPRTAPAVDSGLRRRRWGRALAASVALAVGGGALGTVLVGPWGGGLLAVGWGLGGGLVVGFRPLARRRRRARRLERGLPDAMYLVGQRVADGTAVEAAIDGAAERLEGPAGDALSAVARRQRTLRLPASAALLGPDGPLATVPSRRARFVGRLLVLAGRHGRPAGRSLVAMADHLDELQRVEDEMARKLRRLTDRLGQTATLLGPLVAGGTLALADAMAGQTPTGGGLGIGGPGGSSLGKVPASGVVGSGTPALPVEALGPAVGAYVCWLAVVLAGLRVGLRHGLDPARAGYRVGLALSTAPTAYLASYLLARGLLNV